MSGSRRVEWNTSGALVTLAEDSSQNCLRHSKYFKRRKQFHWHSHLPMASKRYVPSTVPILRATLRSQPSNGHEAFIPQIRKLIFEFCESWPTSSNIRTYILAHLEHVARQNPHVEIVVKQRTHKEPIIRGLYCKFFPLLSVETCLTSVSCSKFP
jgi:hypothetical protein